MRFNYKLIIAMLVLAIFAVGSVSAAENVTADIVDGNVDEIVVDEVAIDDVSTDAIEESTGNDEILTAVSYDVDASMNSTTINSYIDLANASGGGTINFAAGNYTDMALILKSNVHLIGGANVILTGTGSTHVIEVANVENFTISGFKINGNDPTGASVSAIHGSFATNGVISGNTLYNAKNGININKKFDNLTIENNNIYGITYDGISLANPQGNNIFSSLVGATIRNNNISSGEYGMFIGGSFKGTISGNRITGSDVGIQFLGKPNNSSGHLYASIYGNYISGVTTGIELFNPDVIYLNMYLNNIYTVDPSNNYAIAYNSFFAKATGGHIYVTLNILSGLINQTLINQFDTFLFNSGYTIC